MLRALGRPTPDRLRVIAQAFRAGLSVAEIHAACAYEPWFLREIADIVRAEAGCARGGLPGDAGEMRALKAMGFSDVRLARLARTTEAAVRAARHAQGVRPVFKRVDTCAAEFEARTPYMYSTYEQAAFGQIPEDESRPSDRKKAIILGGGPNRIGQGIEFDYCCCHAAFALAELGVESIMVNCNPETVSTDYDTSDRLYFEPLTAEDVLELIAVEQSRGELIGVIVQFGGQTPLKLAQALEDAGVPILGTSPDAIDLAEDRERFQKLLHDIGLQQPVNAIARSAAEAKAAAHQVGYPVVIRPSYVLGGRAMEIVRDDEGLDRYVTTAVQGLRRQPGLDRPVPEPRHRGGRGRRLRRPRRVDRRRDGAHRGSRRALRRFGLLPAALLPPRRDGRRAQAQTEAMARALNVRGLMNVQFAIEEPLSAEPRIYVLEVNPRASRTVPFVAKAIGLPVAAIAAKVMAGSRPGGVRTQAVHG